MEKKLQSDIGKLIGEVEEQENGVKGLNEQIGGLKDEKEKIIEKYDEQIKELNRRINEMSSDFADMLKDTLSKMQDRIEFANKDWQEDTNADVMKKFDHMTNV
eukprot:CAMPEP_0170501958 /NCGR_PEP_ID=MMETSP0208-20121228/40002_1 /TAXON_ID=197538 /ORGANISM="Strombidium inclinatum, Strain S3" /LENGTH=102 /DNA_ID=CAMNT_0010780775 /DNA_START=205 /DNA_END=509 /DNA_ORIENTATION=+